MVPFSSFAPTWAYKVLALYFACSKSRSGASSGRMPKITRVIEARNSEIIQKGFHRNPFVPTRLKSFDDIST